MADPLKITVRPNGPYLIDGPVSVVDADGRAYPLNSDKPRIALCRCGHSASKPFCDGTHARIGFDAAEAAIHAETEHGQS